MSQPVFPAETRAAFAAAYPASPAKLLHRLTEHPLLTIDALAELAQALPAGEIEYNPGALPIGIAPDDVPKAQMGVVETIRTIGNSGSWVALKRVEQVPAYRDLLHALLGELRDVVEPRTGAMLLLEGYIFVSSPGSVTPFHFDPEHNILLQVMGEKTVTVFPVEDEDLLGAEAHELFHRGEHHRNLPWRDEFAAKGQAIPIGPGEAIHIPVKAPHWVQNGDQPSISLSVTWRSEWSYAEADARAFNHVLRRIGLRPASPGPFPAQNRAKALAWRALRRLRRAA
ncbi:cupin-like domain-containing protein [Novosphingobium sp.]|uniref:cupin-like domain-containing protein n=1 Tax=Novosphingobium sp. TaxID=1874826 RepID=UPI00286A49D6|nr:cupin-like domain-containing protein [Novosphingobium sp.]